MSRRKAKRIRKRLEKKATKDKEKQDVSRVGEKKDELKEILNALDFILSLIKAATRPILGHLRVKIARFRITVATPDPVSTALAYGALSQALSYIATLLESNKKVKGLKRADIAIECDFLSETFAADIKLSFSLRVWQLIHIAAKTFFRLAEEKEKKQASRSKKRKNRKRT